MEAVDLARLQFAVTSVYHFFFVPLTLGLVILVAVMETAYVRTGEDLYKRMTKFWGKLFLINFAMGVVTGIVMEFQFGMNWSEYSRYVGDIFGAPLAIEALMAFFIESTFLGVWIFGWDTLSKGMHLAAIWLVAIATNISALWILLANSWMQEPVGYELVDGRAQMNDFFAIVTNPNIFVQYPHVLASGLTTAAFFVMGISAFHLLRQHKDTEFFKRSFSMGMVFGFMGVFLVIVGGHDQAQHMVESQPMKMAAAEALWDSEDPASFSVFTVGDEKDREDVFAVRLPAMLSVLAYNSSEAEVQGINDLQKQYEEQYGEGDYVPPVAITYWSFRIMVGAGFLMLAITILGLFFMFENSFARRKRFLQFMLIAMAFPYIANTAGWTMTEVGRQPWIVFGLQRTEDAISPNVDAAVILFSLIVYTTIYGMLMGADIYLLNKYARRGPDAPAETAQAEETSTAKPVSGLKPQVAPGD